MKILVKEKCLKTTRIKKGLYQTEVAKAIQMDSNAYSQIENGKSTTCKTAKKICDFFGVEFDDFFIIKDGDTHVQDLL